MLHTGTAQLSPGTASPSNGRSAPALGTRVVPQHVSQGWTVDELVVGEGHCANEPVGHGLEAGRFERVDDIRRPLDEAPYRREQEQDVRSVFPRFGQQGQVFQQLSPLGLFTTYPCQEGPLEQVLPRRVCSPPLPLDQHQAGRRRLCRRAVGGVSLSTSPTHQIAVRPVTRASSRAWSRTRTRTLS